MNRESHSVVYSLLRKRFGARGCRARPTPVYTDAGSSTCVRFISNNRPSQCLSRSSQLLPDSSQSTPSVFPSVCISNGIVHPHMRRHDCQPANQLVCATLSTRSVRNKLEVVKHVAKDKGTSVVCLTETWLEDDPIVLRRLRSEGYQVLEQARPPKPKAMLESMRFTNYGGVAIIAPNGVRLTKLNTSSPNSFEHLCACVTSGGSSCVILLVYRPGSKPATPTFFDELLSMLEVLASSSDPLVVTGDINIRLDLSTDPLCLKFNKLIESFGLIN